MNEPNPTPTQPPVLGRQIHWFSRRIKFSIWFPVVIVAAFTAGYLFWQKTLIPGPYDLEPVSVVRHQTADGLDTSNWQTYRNEKYGFEVKYSQLWKYEEINFVNPQRDFVAFKYPYDKETCFQLGYFGCPIEIEIRPNNAGVNIRDIFSAYFPQSKEQGLTQDIYLGTKPAISILNNQDLSKSVVVKTNSYAMRITLIRAEQLEEALKIETEAFNQILSTFKFIEPDDRVCIQVVTPAKNPQTGETRDFPTPCDVPEGWEVL